MCIHLCIFTICGCACEKENTSKIHEQTCLVSCADAKALHNMGELVLFHTFTAEYVSGGSMNVQETARPHILTCGLATDSWPPD